MQSERDKMEAGDWYRCVDPQLDALRARAAEAIYQHNSLPPSRRGDIAALLAGLISAGAGSRIEAPFHCAYGFNIHLEGRVFINAGSVILDTAPVKIGDGSMLGPGVHIYCAHHHTDAAERRAGLERALPVTIGKNVWIGGGAIILPGIIVGDDAIIGAGAVVTKDVPAGVAVVGNPARAR